MPSKVLVIIGDGMADEPLDVFNGHTPLEATETPSMDALAREGFVGLVKNVPPGMEPGSDVAIMSILGYDPATYYTGRGPLEALSMGVTPAPGEAAFRCNLITITDDNLIDYSAGHITTEESGEIIKTLQEKLVRDGVKFHHGVSFRNLMVAAGDFSGVRTHAPHDHMDQPWKDWLPSGDGADLLLDLINSSIEILKDHPVNKARIANGKKPASSIWPWSGGAIPAMISFRERFGLGGAVVSAVDLVQGLGKAAGLAAPVIPGATGLVDTNYEGKVEATIKILQENDFALIHIEGIDEAGHIGDPELKAEGIRRFDRMVVGPLMEEIRKYDDSLLVLLPDHPTPIRIRTHTSEPVPFLALRPGQPSNCSTQYFTEKEAASTGVLVESGHLLLEKLIEKSLY